MPSRAYEPPDEPQPDEYEYREPIYGLTARGDVPDYEPPRPGAPRPPELAEPLPPQAPDPTLPAWLRPASPAEDVPDIHPPGEPASGRGAGAHSAAPHEEAAPTGSGRPGPGFGTGGGPGFGAGGGPGFGAGGSAGGSNMPGGRPGAPQPPGMPEQRQRRWWVLPVVGGLAALLILGGAGTVLLYMRANDSVDTSAGPVVSAAASTAETGPAAPPGADDGTSRGPAAGPTGGGAPQAGTGVPCAYSSADRGGGDPRLVATPAPRSTLSGKPTATLETNLGVIGVQLYADRAPCTVNSFVHLSRDDFYSDTPCHRLTTEGLWVLQCGDPGGTGTGTPGYQFGEENLPTTLPPYPRGTLAMANAGPGTNGSQFFIVYKDSDIPPDYSVFGQVTSGLDLLDRIAAVGTTTGGADGPPKLAVQITEIRVS
ncbi:peptidylprolyl isomerase [Dactylosporangium sp. NPDC005555]|uniref:peptidylprolyl isomerase n=1 Tax=Dactylosporangium sp. NPDC005555 TaxID=3154889 RepID=UPI0033A34807